MTWIDAKVVKDGGVKNTRIEMASGCSCCNRLNKKQKIKIKQMDKELKEEVESQT